MLMSCFTVAALITSPSFGDMHKKLMAMSASKAQTNGSADDTRNFCEAPCHHPADADV